MNNRVSSILGYKAISAGLHWYECIKHTENQKLLLEKATGYLNILYFRWIFNHIKT
jgi:hypothetical protein